jgi:hypothetical protein
MVASNPTSAEITRLYRQSLNRLRSQADGIVARSWSAVDPTDLDGTFPIALDIMDTVVSTLQRESARMADLYVAAYLTSELGEAVDPVGIDPGAYAGITRDGRPVRGVLALGLVSAKVAAGNARNPLASGLARSVRAARTEVVDAARRAQDDLTRDDPRTDGWRRVASSEPCGACLGLAGAKFRDGHLFELHGACRCTAEPITVGRRETHPPATGQELFDSMDEGRAASLYGDEKAAMLAGDLDPSALVVTKDAAQWGPMLYEAPLSSLSG